MPGNSDRADLKVTRRLTDREYQNATDRPTEFPPHFPKHRYQTGHWAAYDMGQPSAIGRVCTECGRRPELTLNSIYNGWCSGRRSLVAGDKNRNHECRDERSKGYRERPTNSS